MNRFYKSVADVLEVESVRPNDDFRLTDGWCSLHAFGLLVMLENDYETRVSIEKFLTFKTVKDLYREAFLSFASSVLKVNRDCLAGDTAYGSLPEWDSVNQLRLVMEAEALFGSSYPLERIPELKTLEDFLDF